MYKLFTFILFVCLFLLNSPAQSPTDKLYGLHFTSSGLSFASMDMTNGEVEILSNGTISQDSFGQGIYDYDPVGKRYFYIRYDGGNTLLYVVDALSGSISDIFTLDNPYGAVTPFTNITYNWLDDQLYGISHEMDGMMTTSRVTTVDPNTGIITDITNGVISTSGYQYGNADIDPVNRMYHYISGDSLYSVNLDDGSASILSLSFPAAYGSSTQFIVNLAYDWMDDVVYGLHFLSIPDPDIFDYNFFSSELRLCSINMQTGEIEVISNAPTSNDGFSMGDCDIDPTNDRYFYVRQNNLYTVDLNTGDLISVVPIQNTNNAVAPIINMAYDDLSELPGVLQMDMEEKLFINQGESISLNVNLGDASSYLWSDGYVGAEKEISEAGTYSVETVAENLGFRHQLSLKKFDTLF